MSISLSSRPVSNLPFLLPSFSSLVVHVPRRNESSARRTTKRLRTKPDASFTSSIPPSQINDYIVFNPPSSVPSPYHTPPVFLPPNDPRRTLLAQSHQHANPYDQPGRHLPPIVHKHRPYEKKYHLGQKEIEEIRRLRTEDPYKWTRAKLAEKFECSQFFVGMVAEASAEKKLAEQRKLEEVRAKWGRRRTYAREDRSKRRELWGKDL
ncbi:mitochondrial ribosomal protein subunit L20-domain-containing protein [Usnea florida]